MKEKEHLHHNLREIQVFNVLLQVAGYPIVKLYVRLYVSYKGDVGVMVEQRTEKQPFCVL